MGSRIEQPNGRDFHKSKQAKLTTLATVIVREGEIASALLLVVDKPERASTDRGNGNGRAAYCTHTTTVTNATRRRQARSLSLSFSLWLGSGFEHETLGSRRLNPSQ
jgi:hypothetical protein